MSVAVLALALVCLAEPSSAQSVVWQKLDVESRLDNDGALHVRETHLISVSAEIATISVSFGLDTDQSVVLKAVERVDDDGLAHPLEPGDLAGADRYAAGEGWLRWSVGQESAPEAGVVLRRYRIEYDLVNALSPAWSIPAGSRPLDPLSQSYRGPLARGSEALAAWREAWPAFTRRYRLDHDVWFPNRDAPAFALRELNYRLEYGTAWRLLNPDAELGRATPDVHYRVQRTLEYLPPGRPPAVDARTPALRIGSLLALSLLGFLLWLGALAAESLGRIGQRAVDPAFFVDHVLAHPPEIVAGIVLGAGEAPWFEDVVKRLVAERKLALQVEPPESPDLPPRARLRLLVSRDRLSAYERELTTALFGDGEETDTESIALRYANNGFDPDAVVQAAFQRAMPAEQDPAPRHPGRSLALVLLAAGLLLALRDLARPGGDPYLLLTGLAGGFLVTGLWPIGCWAGRSLLVALWLLAPLLFLALAGTAIHLIPNSPLRVHAAFALTLLLLGWFQTLLNRARARPRGDRHLMRVDLLRARRWASSELRRPRPALQDAWVPHLEALGLGAPLARWRQRHAASVAGADLSELGPAAAALGPPFTGRAPQAVLPGAQRRAADLDWARGFYVGGDEEDLDE